MATCSLLLECGDANPNPDPQTSRPSATGRKQTAPRSSQCEKTVAKNRKRCVCTTCFEFKHVKCSQGINVKYVSSTTSKQWICHKCVGSVLRFYAHGISASDDDCLIDISSEIINDDILLRALSGSENQLKIMHINNQSMVSTFDLLLLTLKKRISPVVENCAN